MSSGTRSEDYSSTYYNDAHLGGYDNYNWDNEEYRRFFLGVADRLSGSLAPRTTLDVGCARGLLVQALAERGVESRGIDISEHAVDSSHPDVRERLTVASAVVPIEGRFDLISCIEVLEHMSPADAQVAIDNMTGATDRILFSSSPRDYDEATHINTHPTAAWVGWFAERGFFRRTDFDATFLAPWAILLERGEVTLASLAQRYEEQYALTREELVEKRASLLESHRRISTLSEQLSEVVSTKVEQQDRQLQEQADQLRSWEAEVLEARHQLLTRRDHVVGTEAEVARLSRENAWLKNEAARARKQVLKVRERLENQRKVTQQVRRRAARLEAQLAAGQNQPSFARRVSRKLFGGSK